MQLNCVEQIIAEHEEDAGDEPLKTVNGKWCGLGECVMSVGGRWDRRRREYVDDADDACREVYIHPRQVDAIEFFADWLESHVAGVEIPDDERVFSMIMHGGQRGGKTFVGVSVPPIAYTLAIPGSYAWIVCPTADDFEEVEVALEAVLHKSWYRKVTKKTVIMYKLANGSRIVLRSGHRPESLKKGRCDLIVLNECQQMDEQVFAIARGRISDKGGLVIGCANPPTKPIGEWVADWVTEAQNGLRQAVEFYFSPFDNPHVLHASFRAMRQEIDKRTYQIEVLGLMLSIGSTVLYNWDRRGNEVTLEVLARRYGRSSLRNITDKVTERLEGRSFDRVVGADPSQLKIMPSVCYQFFENPLAPYRRGRGGDAWFKWCFAIITGEVVLKNADEEDLAHAWLDAGYDPKRTLIVCDASARWQFQQGKTKEQLEELANRVQGVGSWDVFRYVGFDHVVGPDVDMDKNPDTLERARATTAKICTEHAGPYGQHFLYSLPSNKHANAAFRKWPCDKRGRPSRDSSHADVGDCITYPMQRLYPRRYLVHDETAKVISHFEGQRRTMGYA